MMKHFYSFIVTCILFLPAKLFSQAGTLDKTFGDKGTELTKLNQNSGDINCMIVYADGKILSAGYNYIIRNKADGTIDSTFGNKGKTYDGNRVVSGMVLQTDNKIVVSGNYFETVNEFVAIRYLSNGKTDPSFGTQGIAKFPVSANTAGIALQSNGKILVAGTTIAANSKAVVVRFNTNGTIDSTFGINGIATFALTSTVTGNLKAADIAINSSDKILVAANSQTKTGDVIVYRLTANGSIDNSFGTNGFIASAQLYIASPRRCLALQPDGKIVIGGATSNDTSQFGLVRFLPNGDWDISFGHTGFTHTAFGKWFADITGITLQPDGKIIAVGSITDYHPGNFGFAAARFSSDGSLDKTFGDNGKISRIDKTFRIHATGIGLQSTGKIITAGYADSGNVDFPERFGFVTRLNNDDNAFANSNMNNVSKATSKNVAYIFPNPVKDILHIRNIPAQSSVEIINSNGLSVIRKNNVSYQTDITMAQLLPGIYTVRIVSGETITLLKFLKQ
ncbi:MAG: T9SS type A sorting domain-containing protein [Parafilimonas sp.]